MSEQFEKGMTYFEKENWLKAEETFTYIVYNDPGGFYADDAQFYLGETAFGKEEYLTAIDEYRRLVKRWPNSEYVNKAYWRKTEALVALSPDYRRATEPTERALASVYEYLERYPNTEFKEDANKLIHELKNKMAHKLFDAGNLYKTLEYFDSAIVYYKSVQDEYPESDFVDASILYESFCLKKMGHKDEAIAKLALINKDNLSLKEKGIYKTLNEK
jgi:outer membrane protein assembly factor BamD